MPTTQKTDTAVDARGIFRALAVDKELDGVDLRVFLYLFSRLDFDVFKPVSQIEIASALGRRREHVARSIRRLKDKDMILVGTKVERSPTFRLNPKYGR